ncbi:MAG: ABC transporter substrate-binding protein [Dehalococcoidia bacterium]|nr:ABC transporter substrate-binding protein [Dehalococcoidia bacterium]
MSRLQNRRVKALAYVSLLLVTAAAISCGGEGAASGQAVSGRQQAVTLRLGYFPNVTHAQPLVGLEDGTYARVLGDGAKLETKTFNSGPSVIEALFAGAIDAAYIGPNPAITGYVQSGGKALRIISGAASGGALFVVRPGANINAPADLAKKKVTTPQIGNTQDVALRAYLAANGLKSREDGGNVTVLPTSNANTLTLFQKGDIDAAWVPEPWGTRLIQEAGGKLFLDERDLWPNGDFVTTNLIVSAGFLDKHPDVVERLLKAHIETTQWINANPDAAAQIASKRIEADTGAALSVALVTASWKNLRMTSDPVAPSLRKSTDDAFALGFLGTTKPDLKDIYALDLLNKALAEKGLPPVSR